MEKVLAKVGEGVSQSSGEQVYFYYKKSSAAFPTIVHSVAQDVHTRSNFNSIISKPFDRPEPKPASILYEPYVGISSREDIQQQYSVEILPGQTIELLESSRRPAAPSLQNGVFKVE